MADFNQQRRRWEELTYHVTAGDERKRVHPTDAYDHHLTVLQQKNRLLKKLRRKDDHQIAMERREQGFSVYLNGANITRHGPLRARHPLPPPPPLPPPTQRFSVTGAGKRTAKTAESRVCVTESVEEGEEQMRAKTAPSKRKGWSHESVEVKSETGVSLYIKAPSILTGEYESDFEHTVVEIDCKDGQEEGSKEGGEEGGGDREEEEEEEEDSPDELAVSFNDISILRRSLEGDQVIQTSLREEQWTGSRTSVDSLEASDESCEEALEESDTPSQEGEGPDTTDHTHPPENGIILQFSSQPPKRATRSLSATIHKPLPPISSSTVQTNRLYTHEMPTEHCGTDHAPLVPQSDQSNCVAMEGSQESARDNRITQTAGISGQMQESVAGPSSTAPPRAVSDSLPPLTEDKLMDITERVRKMEPRKQRKLLGLLSCLDQSPLSLPTPPHSLPPQPSHTDNPSRPSSLQSKPTREQQPVAQETGIVPEGVQGRRDGVQVQLHILTNWGHAHLVGLTEVELFSSVDGRRVRVTGDCVRVEGGSGEGGEVARVVNGKTKTTNCKHMWTHPFTSSPPHPLTLTFTLPPHIATENPLRALSKIYIWNYNRSIHELTVGAKDVQVLVNGHLLWEGVIEKGCGSHVFDYHTEILLDRRGGGAQPPWLSLQDGSAKDDHSFVLDPPISRPSSGRMSGLRGQLVSRQSSEPLSLHSSSDTHLPTFLDNGPRPASTDRLRTAVLAKGHRPLRLGSVGSDTCLLPCVDGREGGREEKAGRHVGHRRATIPTSSQPLTVTTPLFPCPTPSSHEPQVSTHDPTHPPLTLEESLASISKFDHTHLGQIGLDYQDDILESFLAEYRQRKQRTLPHAPTPTSPHPPGTGEGEGKGEGEGEGDEFQIPELPSGNELVINILTTWGDRYYVGLSGIEVFTSSGQLANVTEISADPADINVLPQYSTDPRIVSNLLDGINKTRDDLHMWLAPYTPGHTHLIRLRFATPTTIAMVRVWNYNKSRIHSTRGARDVEMYLDGQLVFQGEIAHARGGLTGGTEAFGETILFTTDEDILQLMAENDDAFQGEVACIHGNTETEGVELQRPRTADTEEEERERPYTSASLSRPLQAHMTPVPSHPEGKVIELVITETWGGGEYTGLTGVELVGIEGVSLRLRAEQIVSSGDEEAGRLLDGVNLTTDRDHMWLVPIAPSTPPTLTIMLDTPTALFALRLWNYNASPEESYLGPKRLQVLVDGSLASPEGGFLVRRAPGHVHYDFAQQFSLRPQTQGPQLEEEGEGEGLPSLPRGFVFQFQLLSTWGDPYYIGLNGLELCDASGTPIPLTRNNIAAFPESVNVLEGVRGDVRTPDKLVDGMYDTEDGRHMWLAPVLPDMVNRVYVIFDEPQTVSAITFWNYSKTPSRGVKDFAILVDDLLVFTGSLPSTPTYARGILPTLQPPLTPYTVPFHDHSGDMEDQLTSGGVQFTDSGRVLSATQLSSVQRMTANQELRPLTSLTTSGSGHRQW